MSKFATKLPLQAIIALVWPILGKCGLGIFALGTFAQLGLAKEFRSEEIPLWSSVAPGSGGFEGEEVLEDRGENNDRVTGVSRPTLTLYLPEVQEDIGAGIVICPGGGYGGLAIDKEGHDLAKWFCTRGLVAAVLKYRHGGGQHQHPIPLNDAQRALRLMRSRATEWKIDPEKIGIAGFSAGGHLASTAGTHFDEGDATAKDPLNRVSCQANFLVLIYPVISMREGITHQGTRNNLLGETPSDGLVQKLSNELQVSEATGPTFLVHASDDDAVPVDNCLLFYRALRKHGVPAELHVYETGGHGFGFFRGEKSVDRWPDLLENWLDGRGLVQ